MTERFARERVMHELKIRRLRVRRSEEVAPGMLRVTLGGEDLAGFVSIAPGDHVKVFFPDPGTGALVLPEPGARGVRAEGAVVRDYTPYAFRAAGADGPEIDIDFYLHGIGVAGEAPGPAAAWAAAAQPGDEIAIAGPRGSILPPTDLDEAIIVADESALPAAARWFDALAHDVPVTGLFSVADAATASYFTSREGLGRELLWFAGEDRDAELAEALRSHPIGEGTFLFLAGEANALIPLRRLLRRELALPKGQVEVHGYWKRGVVALDHHAPIDPADPED